jgi:hypothetical protein
MIRGDSMKKRINCLNFVMENKVTNTETVFPGKKSEVFLVYAWAGGEKKRSFPPPYPL